MAARVEGHDEGIGLMNKPACMSECIPYDIVKVYVQRQVRPNESQTSVNDSQAIEDAPSENVRAITDAACERTETLAEDPDAEQMEHIKDVLWAASYIDSDYETDKSSSSPSPASPPGEASGSNGPSVPILRRMMENVQAKAASAAGSDGGESSDDSSGVWVPGHDL